MTPSPARYVKRGSPTLNLTINVHHLLYGEDLEDLGRSHIIVENGTIKEIGQGWRNDPDFIGGVALPLPSNAHVHLNDYRALDRYYGLSLAEYVGSKGLKHPLIRLYKEPLLTEELLNVLIQYRVIVDYQELFLLCREYQEILGKYGILYYGLSRPSSWHDENELFNVIMLCSGVGISNPSRIPSTALPLLAQISLSKIVSAHVSETKYMEETGGLHYLINSRIKLKHIVHGVYLEDWELKFLADNDIALVITPRSNIWFLNKLPNVLKALEYGVVLALGTDNAGCFHPDVWLDAYYLHSLLKIEPKKVLEMILINGYKAIGEKPVYIYEGEKAFFMIADLGLANERSGNIYLSLINRILWSKQKLIIKYDRMYLLGSKMEKMVIRSNEYKA